MMKINNLDDQIIFAKYDEKDLFIITAYRYSFGHFQPQAARTLIPVTPGIRKWVIKNDTVISPLIGLILGRD